MGYVSLVMRSINLGICAKGYFCWIPIQLRKWKSNEDGKFVAIEPEISVRAFKEKWYVDTMHTLGRIRENK